MSRFFPLALIATLIATRFDGAQSPDGKPLRLAIAGLNHGHVSGFLRSAQQRAGEVVIVGVWDPDATLLAQYAGTNHLATDQTYTDLNKMLDAVKPEAVAAFTDTYSHVKVVEACASRQIPVMMEKPLAVNMNAGRGRQTDRPERDRRPGRRRRPGRPGPPVRHGQAGSGVDRRAVGKRGDGGAGPARRDHRGAVSTPPSGQNARGTLFTVQKALPLLSDGASVFMTGSSASVKGATPGGACTPGARPCSRPGPAYGWPS